MKKTISLLLALVLCLSLCACGNAKEMKAEETELKYNDYDKAMNEGALPFGDNEQSSHDESSSPTENNASVEAEPEKQVIEITMDNWQEYFEIRQYVTCGYIGTNDFGEVKKVSYDFITLFTLKEEYAEKIDPYESEIAIEYDADWSTKKITWNAIDFAYEVTDSEMDLSPHFGPFINFVRGATSKLGVGGLEQNTMKDGKVEEIIVEVPFASVISGCELYSDGEVQIFMDNNEEWKEENEGWVPFTENVVITRIKGSITLFK